MKQIFKKKCSVCNGKGFVKVEHYPESDKKLAIVLRENGMTYRRIAEVLGIDHPQKVKTLIRRKKETL